MNGSLDRTPALIDILEERSIDIARPALSGDEAETVFRDDTVRLRSPHEIQF